VSAAVERVRRRWFQGVELLLVVAGGVLLWFLISQVSTASSQLNGLRTNQTAQAKTISDLGAALGAAEQQLTQHGIKPLPPPPGVIIQQGTAGPPGPGPSDAQVLVAVTQYLTVHPLPTAAAPSQAQIAAVVAEYLKANPPAAGKDGAPGAAASNAQVANAVAVYLAAHPPASGKDGKDGKDGEPGASGASGVSEDPGAQGAPGKDGEPGRDGVPGSPGPACPDGYSPTPETVNGHAAVVCEEPSSTPAPTPSPTATGTPSGPVPSSPGVPAPSALALPLLSWLTLPRDPRRR
jgi:Collagen triple helix repeat (20 copies)